MKTSIFFYTILAFALALSSGCKSDGGTGTTPAATAPVLTTTAASNTTSTTSTSGGNVTSDGGAAVTARGVCLGTGSNLTPTISDPKTSDGSGTGSFTSAITGLSASTTYYVRAYATNSVGTSYGSAITFTSAAGVPAVNTTPVTTITQTGATSGGAVSSDGGASVTVRGVCWSTGSTPTISNSKTTDGSGTGSFTSTITGLTASTTYFVRAYATNSAGTGYGGAVTFTSQAPPVILNNGTPTTWTTRQTTIGTAAYSPLEVRIVQSGGTLTGTVRDNTNEVDVLTSGTIDGTGHVSLTATLSNGGSPRQTLTFSGTVNGSGSSQTITGTYTAILPTESGTFSMTHN